MSNDFKPYYHTEIQTNPNTTTVQMRKNHGGNDLSSRRDTGYTVQKTRYRGIDNTVNEIKKLIVEARTDVSVRDLSLAITAHLPASERTAGNPNMRDFDGVAKTLYAWVIQNIRYTRDPNDTEWLQAPMVTVAKRAGDCDDMTILSCALMESVGVPTRFRIMGRGDYQHIIAEYEGKNGWTMFDPTLGATAGMGPDMASMTHDKIIGLSDLSGGIDPITAVANLLNTGISAITNKRNVQTTAQLTALQIAENDKQRAHELAIQRLANEQKAVPIGNRTVFWGEDLDIAGYKIPMLPVLFGGVIVAILLARK